MDSKKLLVLSDIHGSTAKLKQVFTWAQDSNANETPIRDTVFLGDGINELYRVAEETGFYSNLDMVRGNNDYDSEMQEAAVFYFEEHSFFLCHGHRYALYNGYSALTNAARLAGAGAALFGHTHVPYKNRINGITLINPGSIGNPRSRTGSTFAVIECETGKPFNVKFYGISNIIKEITIYGS